MAEKEKEITRLKEVVCKVTSNTPVIYATEVCEVTSNTPVIYATVVCKVTSNTPVIYANET